MQVAEWLAYLDADGVQLADAAARAGLDARVVACDWAVRDLVTHTGGVHRWAAAVVRTASATTEIAESAAVGSGPPDTELLDWFRAGHAELVRVLRDAPDDLDCATFLPASSPRAFWARRQAHETAIHRADAESASGAITAFAPDLAQDGIAELLTGFAHRRVREHPRPALLALRSTDSDVVWRVELGGERVEATATDSSDGDAVISGSSSDLYLWLWNRPSSAHVDGATDLADQWRRLVRVRWS